MYFGIDTAYHRKVKLKTSKSPESLKSWGIFQGILLMCCCTTSKKWDKLFHVVSSLQCRSFFGPTIVGVDFLLRQLHHVSLLSYGGWAVDGRKTMETSLWKHPCQAAINKKRAFQPFEALRHLACTWHFDIILGTIHYDLSQWTHLPICNSKGFCLMGPGFPMIEFLRIWRPKRKNNTHRFWKKMTCSLKTWMIECWWQQSRSTLDVSNIIICTFYTCKLHVFFGTRSHLWNTMFAIYQGKMLKIPVKLWQRPCNVWLPLIMKLNNNDSWSKGEKTAAGRIRVGVHRPGPW